MDENECYDKAVKIFDNFFEESNKDIERIIVSNDWKHIVIYKLFTQTLEIAFCLLMNTEKSKFKNDKYVKNLTLYGSLGRILRDIYVNIIYLKSNCYGSDQMKLCWEFQAICQKIKLAKFELSDEIRETIKELEMRKDEIKECLKTIEFKTKGRVLDGKDEKMLALEDLVKIKSFNKEKFKNEFDFFSQFTHCTAFANTYIKLEGKDDLMIALVYHRMVPYFVGIVTESIELFFPNHCQLKELKTQYHNIIEEKWN